MKDSEPGTLEERLSLSVAIAHNCGCIRENGRTIEWCAAHLMCANLRVVNGLFFARRLAARLVAEEFLVPGDLAGSYA